MAPAGRRAGMTAAWPAALAACLLAACRGGEAPVVAAPPLPAEAGAEAQAPPAADARVPVTSGDTAPAADIAALAALRAGFDPARDPAADLATARLEAARGGRRIVLEFGQAGCRACEALSAHIEGELALRRLRDAGLVWVKVDRGAPDNAGFVAGYPGADRAPAPYLLVLDADGQVLHAQDGRALLRDGRPDGDRVRGFLEQWASPPATP